MEKFVKCKTRMFQAVESADKLNFHCFLVNHLADKVSLEKSSKLTDHRLKLRLDSRVSLEMCLPKSEKPLSPIEL
jgi:hypothetical protein